MAVWALLTLRLVGGGGARAEVIAFHLDTNRSVVELRGTVRAFGLNLVLNDQAPGSRRVPWRGTVWVDAATNGVRFLGGHWMPLMESGSWEPDANGLPGFAPANYGLKPAANLGSIRIEGRAACRQWGFEILSTNLTLARGQFALRPVRLQFLPAERSAVDYRFVLTVDPGDPDFAPPANPVASSRKPTPQSTTVIAGRAWMSGALTNRTTLPGSLALESGVETLTLPLGGWHSFTTTSAGHEFQFDLILVGQLVGTRTAAVRVEPPAQPGEPMRLVWPTGYRLQRTPQLFPANWRDDAINSPVEITPAEPTEFFRAVRYAPAVGEGLGR